MKSKNKCRECGKELPTTYITDICLDCSRENAKKIFQEHPEVKEALREAIEELRKPENVDKMAKQMSKMVELLKVMKDDNLK